MSRTLIRLVLAVAVMVIAAMLLTRRAPDSGDMAHGPILPGLTERVNAVDRVTLRVADGDTATLLRKTSGWVVQERHDWPADTGKLRDYLLRLGTTQRLEAKTERPESYARLGVQDIDAPDANGVQVEIVGGGEPLSLIIGQNNAQGHGSYVRMPGQARSWQTDLDIAPERQVANWLQRDLIDVDPRRIVHIEIHPDKAAAFTLSRPGMAESHWQLAPLPRNHETAQGPADAVVGFLQGLSLEDVRPINETPSEGAWTAQFDTADGLRVDVRLWQQDSKPWANLSVQFDPAQATVFAQAQLDAEQKAASEAKRHADAESDNGDADAAPTASVEQRVNTLREQAERASERFKGWQFAITPYKADNLRKAVDEYAAADQ